MPDSNQKFVDEAAALAAELVALVEEMESDFEVRRSLNLELSHRLFRLRVKAERLLDRDRGG